MQSHDSSNQSGTCQSDSCSVLSHDAGHNEHDSHDCHQGCIGGCLLHSLGEALVEGCPQNDRH